MKIKIRKSNLKGRRRGGFLTRQKTRAGQKVNARRRRGHK
jgi:ribosomal protein L34